MSRKWKIICLSLLAGNLIMLQWLFRINEERAHAEQWLGDLKWGEGLRDAERDYRAGNVRIYSMEIIPYPKTGQPIHQLTNEYSGRKEGSLEFWKWRRYQPEDKLTERMWQQELNGYNGRMTNLHQKNISQVVTNARSSVRR